MTQCWLCEKWRLERAGHHINPLFNSKNQTSEQREKKQVLVKISKIKNIIPCKSIQSLIGFPPTGFESKSSMPNQNQNGKQAILKIGTELCNISNCTSPQSFKKCYRARVCGTLVTVHKQFAPLRRMMTSGVIKILLNRLSKI